MRGVPRARGRPATCTCGGSRAPAALRGCVREHNRADMVSAVASEDRPKDVRPSPVAAFMSRHFTPAGEYPPHCATSSGAIPSTVRLNVPAGEKDGSVRARQALIERDQAAGMRERSARQGDISSPLTPCRGNTGRPDVRGKPRFPLQIAAGGVNTFTRGKIRTFGDVFRTDQPGMTSDRMFLPMPPGAGRLCSEHVP